MNKKYSLFIFAMFFLSPVLCYAKTSKIIDGALAAKGASDFAVAIVKTNEQDNHKAAFCGATIISDRWAITAAHCVCNDQGQIEKKSGDIAILEGAYNLTTGEGKRIPVRDIIPHPFYTNRVNHAYDIAMIELAEPAGVNSIPVCYSDIDRTGQTAAVVGFGKTSNTSNDMSPDKKVASLPIVSRLDCQSTYGASSVTNDMVCAGWPEGGNNTCYGDSGGPLLIMDNGEMKLYGVVSWSSSEGCALPGKPTVFAKVSDPNLYSFISACKNKPAATAPCAIIPKGLNANYSSIPTVGQIINFSVDTASECASPTVYYYYSYCPNYGAANYDPNFWTPLSNGFTTNNQCPIVLNQAGNYVIVAWVSASTSAPNPIQLIGTTLTVFP